MRRAAVLGLAVVLAGCDPERPPEPEPLPEVAVTQTPLRVTPATSTRGARRLLVLINTPYELYQVDPDTLDVTLRGAFSFPDSAADAITDIAIDAKGRMWGVGFEAVYAIDPMTLACTLLARHPGLTLNSLAIMTSAMTPGREAPDVMLAAQSRNATIYQVDPRTGELATVGDVGAPLSASGDLTWAAGVGAVMLASDFAGYEGLVALERDTFAATRIGPGWAFQKVRGLSLLPTGLLGVTEQGEMLAIDPRTGDAVLRRTHPLVFYGGAVGWDDATP